MNLYDITPITDTAVAPYKTGTMDFIQKSHQGTANIMMIHDILKTYQLPYLSTTPYVLYGCEKTVVGSSVSFNAGAIFYNGELFIANTVSGLTTSTQYGVITTTYTTAPNADPVTLGDGSTANVHSIRTISFQNGSGLFDTATMVYVNNVGGIPTYLESTTFDTYAIKFDKNYELDFTTVVGGSSSVRPVFDFTNAVPGKTFRAKILASTGATLDLTGLYLSIGSGGEVLQNMTGAYEVLPAGPVYFFFEVRYRGLRPSTSGHSVVINIGGGPY